MSCQEIKSWTFNELVGAFLDLAITYFLLCAATVAFFAAKFLGLFGLCLPCPCNGLFGNPNRNKCWQRVLVDCPSENVSSVLLSAKSRFPFDSIWEEDLNFETDVVLTNDGNCENDTVGLEGEASCSSFKERKSGMGVESGLIYARDGKGMFDMKRRGVLSQKARYLRRRVKSASDNGVSSSVSSYDCLKSDARAHPRSPGSVNKMSKTNEGNIAAASSGGDALHFEDSKESSRDIESVTYGLESNETVDENKSTDKYASAADDFIYNAQGELCTDSDEKNMVTVLEQALEEEHAACAALYLELEKERNAAATAADEAMAMILRLQEEKALIEMEARQYQRMIEEKSAYDSEEMSILKEILLRREREKHFLEKEVETYRQMIVGNEQLDSDVQVIGTTNGKRASSLLYSGEGPLMMLQTISESTYEKENAQKSYKFSGGGVLSVESQNSTLAFGKELPIPESDEVDFSEHGCIHRHPNIGKLNQGLSSGNEQINKDFPGKELVSLDKSPSDQVRDFQRVVPHSQFNLPTRGSDLHEKTISTIVEAEQQSDSINTSLELASKTTEELVSIDKSPSDQVRDFQRVVPHSQCNLPTRGSDLHEKTISTIVEAQQQSDSINTSLGSASKTTEISDQTKSVFPYDDSDEPEKDSCGAAFDLGSKVHDVHVIDDKIHVSGEINKNLSENLSVNMALDIPRTCDNVNISRIESEHAGSRSHSDITNELPPLGNSIGKSLISELRRNSMSAVDYERFKIDSEVGWLRERLRIIQEGREKLNISMENKEKEKMQLQLLENIVSQLREIRKSSEHGKAVRQASLPPLSCKAMSKKRRWRSVSFGVRRST